MNATLTGLRILVTGASSGLGRHCALALARQGAQVAACARRAERLGALAAEAAAAGAVLHPVALDVTDDASVAAGVAAAAAAMGGLDGLVNNAGVAWGGAALDMPMAEWRRVIDVNLDSVFRVAQASARIMATARDGSGGRGGAIVNIASILAFGTGRGVAAYAVSKAGVVHLTRALALEWAGRGIRVNALAPGYIPTDINRAFLEGPEGAEIVKRIPMRRFGAPEDLDGPLALLLTDAGRYVTGVTIAVDGGHLVAPLA